LLGKRELKKLLELPTINSTIINYVQGWMSYLVFYINIYSCIIDKNSYNLIFI